MPAIRASAILADTMTTIWSGNTRSTGSTALVQRYPSLDALLAENPGKAPPCPMCGAAMRLDDAASDTAQSGRLSFSCPNCWHQESMTPAQFERTFGPGFKEGAWTLGS